MLFNGFLLYLSIYIQFEVAGAAYYCLHCSVLTSPGTRAPSMAGSSAAQQAGPELLCRAGLHRDCNTKVDFASQIVIFCKNVNCITLGRLHCPTHITAKLLVS